MAKISARGDMQRWKFRNDAGAELVYTSRGRLLLKVIAGGRYTVLHQRAGEATALAEAERRGMVRVAR